MPRPVVQMFDSGERSGQLGQALTRAAQFLEEELRARVRTATRLIERAMVFVMGIIVGGIAIVLLLPILSISRVIAR